LRQSELRCTAFGNVDEEFRGTEVLHQEHACAEFGDYGVTVCSPTSGREHKLAWVTYIGAAVMFCHVTQSPRSVDDLGLGLLRRGPLM
jgi:hypothetical protein